MPSLRIPLIFCLMLSFLASACASRQPTSDAPRGKAAVIPAKTPDRGGGRKIDPALPQKTDQAAHGQSKRPGRVAPSWRPLLERLRSDNLGDAEYREYFKELADYSPEPMGTKIRELFTNAFLRRPPKKIEGPILPPKARIYRKVVTEAAREKCAAFLEEHREAFAAAENRFLVPREILVALLYLETRLGEYLGSANALWTLACMAAATEPEQLEGGMGDLPISEKHAGWLRASLANKSAWAYQELKALLVYCRSNETDPRGLTGSVYGAIGLCQFMPSNIVPYGQDGNGDGRVDLFNPADAVFSAASYLNRHGWERNISPDQQRALLRRYNNLMTYANTILTLAESVRTGVLQSAPPDMAGEVLNRPSP
ncbi:MAG: lytic murein transglycosylase [Deltaproteobacteria bacterium]|nr:lytic murein transglycosylase [Deltaproteobacteria bacterium]